MAAQQDDLVKVHVGNGHKTSAGTGPGVFELPCTEANALAIHRHARIIGLPGQPDREAIRAAKGVSN